MYVHTNISIANSNLDLTATGGGSQFQNRGEVQVNECGLYNNSTSAIVTTGPCTVSVEKSENNGSTWSVVGNLLIPAGSYAVGTSLVAESQALRLIYLKHGGRLRYNVVVAALSATTTFAAYFMVQYLGAAGAKGIGPMVRV